MTQNLNVAQEDEKFETYWRCWKCKKIYEIDDEC